MTLPAPKPGPTGICAGREEIDCKHQMGGELGLDFHLRSSAFIPACFRGALKEHRRFGGNPLDALVGPIPKGPTDSHVPVV